MTANQRRPGFRLPWSSENAADPARDAGAGSEGGTPPPADEAPPATGPTTPPATTPPVAQPAAAAGPVEAAGDPAAEGPTAPASAEAPIAPPPASGSAAEPAPPAGAATSATTSEPPSSEFLRDLVAAMRRVAEEARKAEVTSLHQRTDEFVARLEADVERRREELRKRAEQDIAEVGEWAKAEAERIKAEAEQRVAARRSQLERQLSAEGARGEAEANALRQRIAEYERELDAFHAQLAEINDPAAFAAAAKRVPQAPAFDRPEEKSSAGPATPPAGAPAERPAPPTSPAAPPPAPPAAPAAETATAAATNGVPAAAVDEVHPAEEEVLASRLAELDAELEPPASEPAAADPATTEVVVKGLGSFGAITGFRQSLSAVEGVQGVALSLGSSGEFIFRAMHAAGFDVGAAIRSLEGDAARIDPRPEGGLVVTLERGR